MTYETLILERPRDGVAQVTLSRPDARNAMTGTMFAELLAAAAELAADHSVRATVLTGAGRYFCPGFDLSHVETLQGFTVSEMLRFQEAAARAVMAWHDIPTPVIAAVNGPAAGGGFALTLAADIRVASTEAKFAAMFVRGGFSAGDLGCSWFLPRLVGLGRATEIAARGRTVLPEEAERIGLVTDVVAPDALIEHAQGIASEIAALAPMGVRMTLAAINANVDAPSLRTAIELENRGQTLLSPGPDVAEVLAAKTAGRPPVFPD